MNWAFMQKVGWGLINDRDELWVQVIRSRYYCGNDIIPRISWRNGGSNLWKGVCKVWSDISRIWVGVLGMVELFVSGWTLGFLG